MPGLKILNCTACEDFEGLALVSQLENFRVCFSLLHDDNNIVFKQFVRILEGKLSIEDAVKDANRDNYKSINILEVATETLLCQGPTDIDNKDRFRKGKTFIDNTSEEGPKTLSDERAYKWFNDYMDGDISHELTRKVMMSIRSNCGTPRAGHGGISLELEIFRDLFTLEETMWFAFTDYQREKRRKELGAPKTKIKINVDLLAPLSELEKSFKQIIKEKKKEHVPAVHKSDARGRQIPFDVWEGYILAYLLYKKRVRASLLNPDWPDEKLTKSITAGLLFPEEVGDIEQKLKDYISNAKELIELANGYGGPFGLNHFLIGCYFPRYQNDKSRLY